MRKLLQMEIRKRLQREIRRILQTRVPVRVKAAHLSQKLVLLVVVKIVEVHQAVTREKKTLKKRRDKMKYQLQK